MQINGHWSSNSHQAYPDLINASAKQDGKADLLAQLLALNQQVAARLARAEPVTALGLPAAFPNPETLITDDCIRPSTFRQTQQR